MFRNVSASIMIFALVAQWSFAFEWTVNAFPDGDQRYVLEISTGSGETAMSSTVEIHMTDQGDDFEVLTTMALRQDVPKDEMDIMSMGGFTAGVNMLAPAMMFGPMFMVLPMMLEGQDIRVRSEPLVLLGFGEMHMERTEVVAGHECVVIRFEPSGGEDTFEFALAENVPFPCFSRYDSGDEVMEMRLISAQ